MNKEEIEAIETVKEIRKSDLMSAEFDIEELYNAIQTTLNLIDKLQKENEELKKVKEQSQKILSSIKIIYMVHTKDCELTLKAIKKWEKLLKK